MKQSGYTLIEVLVVIAILGILMGLSSWGLMGYLAKSRARETAEATAASLREAVNTALSRSEGITVKPTADNKGMNWKNGSGAVNINAVLPNDGVIMGIVPAEDIKITGRGLPLKQYKVNVKAANIDRTVILMITGKVVLP